MVEYIIIAISLFDLCLIYSKANEQSVALLYYVVLFYDICELSA